MYFSCHSSVLDFSRKRMHDLSFAKSIKANHLILESDIIFDYRRKTSFLQHISFVIFLLNSIDRRRRKYLSWIGNVVSVRILMNQMKTFASFVEKDIGSFQTHIREMIQFSLMKQMNSEKMNNFFQVSELTRVQCKQSSFSKMRMII